MTTKELETVRSAVIAANPAIMELGFGCEVIAESSLVKNSYWHATLVSPNMGLGHWTCVAWQDAFPNISKFSTFKENNFKHILGRPIRLGDIILAMGEKYKKDFPNSVGKVNDELLVGLVERWDCLKDDLREQTEETLEYICSML